jgi:hypothetical protein
MGYGFARFTIAMLSLSGCTQTQPTAGTVQNVVFTETTPLTGNAELLRRSLSQPEFAHVRQALAHVLMDAASLEHALNILEAAPGRRSARCG